MKVIELLKLNRQLLNVCRDEGIRIDDVRYIELYNDYRHMLAMGDKVSYIVALLAVRYNVSERKVYSLINRLIADIRNIVGDSVPRHKPIVGELRERIFSRIEQEERDRGYVDFITLSSSLMFSMKYKLSIPGMRKETLYNNIRKADYPDCSADYLNGLEVVSCDYKEAFAQFKDVPGVVFLVDPPYLSTDVGTYNMYWKMSDYLDVLNVLLGHSFVYFTSNKSSILELCEWLGRNQHIGNPFKDCTKVEFNATMNYAASYTDMMLFKKCAI